MNEGKLLAQNPIRLNKLMQSLLEYTKELVFSQSITENGFPHPSPLKKKKKEITAEFKFRE